jgi:arylsulfatase A-like enzyme
MKRLFLALLLGSVAAASAAEKPNILFILSDDIGYGDVGCYGATLVKTPNIDRLAREGRRFTDAHSPASTCTPTRRALITGTYSWRQQPGSAIAPGDEPLTIPVGTVTLPSLLKQAGYTTGAVGKWHLGLGGEGGPDWNGEIKPGLLDIGFDYAFNMAATGDRVPCVYIENRRVVGLDPTDPIKVSYKAKVGDDPTGRENPELLKLKHTHGHDMTIVNGVGRIGWMTGGKAARWVDEEMADTFTRKAIGFIERSADRPFFLYFATHNIHVPRVPNPRFKGSSQCGTRGDSIHELDDSVGQVLAALERLKLTDKTLVIFTSDNGGVMDDGYEDFGSMEHKCNGALHGFKGSLYEGGHRVPFIARWPGKIKAGSECGELITLLDMAASFAALTGVPLPEDAVLDSINVLPALLDQPHDKPLRKDFIAHTGGIKGPFGIRQGPWKLVMGSGGYGAAQRADRPTGPQLFNLDDDLSETKNLAAEHPEIVQKLKDLVVTQREVGRTRP